MKKNIIRNTALACIACLTLIMSACNTTKGFGKDIEKGGEGIKNSADKHGAD